MYPGGLPDLGTGPEDLWDGVVNTAQYLGVVGGDTLRPTLGEEH